MLQQDCSRKNILKLPEEEGQKGLASLEDAGVEVSLHYEEFLIQARAQQARKTTSEEIVAWLGVISPFADESSQFSLCSPTLSSSRMQDCLAMHNLSECWALAPDLQILESRI